jgi:pyruvate/2-oxoglutarate dehydrogenase complex dihydrolipoamide dehydrogenase (E3) component
MSESRYDLAIIGAGSGGLVAARFAAQLGAKVALAERNRIGGDCTWTGCVPSKALLKAAKVAHEVRTAAQYGVLTSAPVVEMASVREYVRSAIEAVYRFETPEALKDEGIDVYLGAAQFLDASTISVGKSLIRSKSFLLTTGARPFIPSISGLTDVPFTTYETIFGNRVLPKTMVIIGGGPIGTEMALAYQRLGAEVTVISEHVLSKEDPDVQQLIQSVLEKEGVRFVRERARSVQRNGSLVLVSTKQHQAQGEILLVAAGRKPNVDGLDLEKAAVRYSLRGVPVDDRLRTNVKHIYAAGDVTGGYQFTHYAGWQAFQAVRNALLPGTSSGVSNLVPWVTFTDPEVAHIGLSEAQAKAEFGDDIQIHRWNMDQIDRAVCENDRSGFVKIIAKLDGTILAATVVAARAGEAIVELIVAMNRGMKMKELAGTIHPYPTYSTAVQQMAAGIAVEQLLGGTSGKLVLGLSKIIRSL